MKYKSGVYKIINKITGKFYIGRSIELEKRFWRHRYELERNIHHCLYLQRSWSKYGGENFEFVIFRECSKEEAASLEQFILDTEKENLYNTSDQASGGDLISYHPERDKIVEKIRKANISRLSSMTDEEKKEKFGRKGKENRMYDRTHTQLVKDKLSSLNKGNSYAKGVKRTEEQRRRLSEIASSRTGEKNPFYGREHSEETKRKLSEQRKGIKPTNSRPVMIDGVEYESVTEASRRLNVVPGTIIHRIKSKNVKYKDYYYKV